MTRSDRFKLAHQQARAARNAGQEYRVAFAAALKASYALSRLAADPLSELHRTYDGAAKANRAAGRNSVFSRQSAEACRAVGRALTLHGTNSDWFIRAKANQAYAWNSFNQQNA